MANIYEWLKNVHQPSYSPTSPPFMPADNYLFTVDPSLLPMTESLAATTPGQTVVMIPKQFAEASTKLLIHLIQTVKVPETSGELDKETAGEMMFTAGELEALEPILEEGPETSIPNIIDGTCVNGNPKSWEIKDLIDLRRVGSNRKTFYLARSLDGAYYWFHSRRTDRDELLRKFIRDYHCKS